MNNQKIQKLLDRYFEGETSLEEEAVLAEYFRGEQIDPAFKPFQPLFQYFESERQPALAEDFEQRMLAKIQAPKPLRIGWVYRIAAAAAIIAGMVFFFPRQEAPAGPIAINWEQYEPETEEEALAQATAALQLLAEKLNGGARTATDELQKIEKTSDVFK
jgi:hypothetical protein